MQRNEKKSIKFCLGNLCGLNQGVNKDYEIIQYKKEVPNQLALRSGTPKPTKNKISRRLTHLNKLTTRRNLIHDPVFHSTNISHNNVSEESESNSYKEFDGTFSDDSTTFAFSNSIYDSPVSSRFSESANSSSNTCSDESAPFSLPIHQKMEVYVCKSPYTAKYEGDISLKYTERVNILYATEEFTLVKKIDGANVFGYVSTACLTSLQDFIKSF